MKIRHRPKVRRDYREHIAPIHRRFDGPVLEVLPEHRMADGRVMLEWSGDPDRGNFKARLVPRAELEEQP